MNQLRVAAFAVVLVGLCGCVSSGVKVTDEQAAQFQKGVTTETEVVAKLGKPNSTTHTSDGTIIDIYLYVHATPDAVDFIPVVGLLAGGATGTSSTVSFTYTAQKILKDYTSSVTTSEVKTGLIQ